MSIAARLAVLVGLSVDKVEATVLSEIYRLEVSLQIPGAGEGDLTIIALMTLFSKVKRVLPDVIGKVFASVVIKVVAAQLALD
jgi:hypothetical protein